MNSAADEINTERCVSVVMPAFNEVGTIAAIVQAVLAQNCVAELIAIDDASTDGSWEKLSSLQPEPRLTLLRHARNQGKGAAIRTGLAKATAPIVIIQDADLEYDPREYGKLIRPIVAGRADVVFGSRFRGSEEHRVLYFWHSVGNKFLTLLSNALSNLNLTDMETGYKAIRRELLQGLTLVEDRFGFEPELTAKVARCKARIYEVAISYRGRTYSEGKKIDWRDGLSAIRSIITYNLFSQQ